MAKGASDSLRAALHAEPGRTPPRRPRPRAAPHPPNPNSPCSLSLAGATGGARAGSPMHVWIFRTTVGSVTVAMIVMRPSQRGHFSTSASNTRRISSAHDSLVREGDASPAAPAPHPPPRGASSGAFGTMSLRHAAFGASVPWYLS